MKTVGRSLSVLGLALVGCADGASERQDAPSLGVHFAALGTCGQNGNADRQFPANADRIVVELSGPALQPPFTLSLGKDKANAQGELVFEKIPVGTGLTLRAAACNGAAATWVGVTNGVAITEFQKAFPEVFLTPVDGVACVGNGGSADAAKKTSEARIFAATAARGDATWVLGGAKKVTGSPPVLEGSATVDAYDRLSGEFEAVGTLGSARIGALARPLEDGRVRIVGGATKLRLAAGGKPPISADAADAPASASEIFDPATGTATAEVATALPVLPALGVMANGAVVAAGGGAAPTFSKNLALLMGTAIEQADMATARFGAVVVALDATHALVWGGNSDAQVANLGLVLDTSAGPAAGQTALTVTGATSVPAFASAVSLGTDADGKALVLVAGGTTIAAANVYTRDVPATGARLDLLTIDIAGGTVTVTAVDRGTLDAAAFARVGANLVRLADGSLAFFGGYTAFAASGFCPGSTADCIQSSITRFGVTTSGTPTATAVGAALESSVGPLGASYAALADGSWLLVAGLKGIQDTSPTRDAGLLRYGGFDPDLCATVH